MSVIFVTPGDAIVAADVESSWASVQGIINAQAEGNLRRDALNGNQLPRLIADHTSGTHRPRQFTSTLTPVTVNSAYVSTSSADIRTNWQNVLTLNSTAGAGWPLDGTYTLIIASVYVDSFAAADEDNAALMAVTYSQNAGSHVKPHESDWRYVQQDDDTDLLFSELLGTKKLDKGMHLWTLYESAAPATLTAVKLWCAKGGPQNWTMSAATLGIYSFHNGN